MAQLTPIRGFINTPVSRLACIVLTVSALLVSIFQIKHLFKLTIDPFLTEYHQYWRLILFQISFVNESDYLLAVILAFQFKVLERFYGSKKYMSLVVVFALYNGVLTFLIMSLGQLLINFGSFLANIVLKRQNYAFHTTFLNTISPGPFGIISSLYICFGHYIPVSYQFKIVLSKGETEASIDADDSRSLILTDHFQIHIIYTLFLLNNGVQSFIPGLTGLFIGKLYVENLLPGSKTWLLPTSIFKLVISPQKTSYNLYQNLRSRVSGYSSLQGGESSEPFTENDNDNEFNDNDDREEVVEDERNNNYNEIRAETPVRPLARQFLDTFRTGE
ncbi:hypothetical protein CANTEDRAFT_124940 [Yamadazyma tenuis ATCC 10573]|uniref:Peptidase S54 rhomboid domain-containing protein n=1 Tax=Candida tenuis (strain ATCC 10573 / BCRC 21748 / CBS 615 / JCM 9827 / NBRC 10315 / NRRL Y-1498 / VKM Y-70) TaxID=590646 RepID=G3B8W3_CANTC|nr:uncharacterized protein CANTEDRAFT_124940 [Yamadazyma tenuis ATCC 10573]EGV61789.1 hypothetical protein CANTEDRAFT_124940 [Yamadazyma tenuis ATCC 10573]